MIFPLTLVFGCCIGLSISEPTHELFSTTMYGPIHTWITSGDVDYINENRWSSYQVPSCPNENYCWFAANGAYLYYPILSTKNYYNLILYLNIHNFNADECNIYYAINNNINTWYSLLTLPSTDGAKHINYTLKL